jgi:hypothetical protein
MTNINDFNGSYETVNRPSYDFDGSSRSSPNRIETAQEFRFLSGSFLGYRKSH